MKIGDQSLGFMRMDDGELERKQFEEEEALHIEETEG